MECVCSSSLSLAASASLFCGVLCIPPASLFLSCLQAYPRGVRGSPLGPLLCC
jgi:hypothetical protein